MSFGGNPTMKSGPPIQPGANAGIWSPPPTGTYTPSTNPTSVWTYNPNAGVQTGIPQGGHAKGAIAQYLQGTSPVKLSYDSAAHDAWLKDALDKARKAGEVRYEEPKQSRASAAVALPPRKKKGLSHEERMAEMNKRHSRIRDKHDADIKAGNTTSTKTATLYKSLDAERKLKEAQKDHKHKSTFTVTGAGKFTGGFNKGGRVCGPIGRKKY